MDDMILLAEVAETGSFTRAGERIGMPKSTVSQRIAQLEARLGLRLLNRSTRHVSLTGSGQVYLEYCRRVRAEVLAANMAMTNLREQPVGKLKITCPEVTATYFMPSFLHGFTTQFPGIAIELIATNRHLNIIRERVDFAFRVGTTTGQDIIIRRISSIKRVLVAAPAFLASAIPLREPTDLLRRRCLVHDAQPEWVFSSDDTPLVLRPPPAATSDSMGFLLQSCIAGDGVALLPAYVCQPSVAVGRLVELFPGWEIPPYEMMLIFPHLKNHSKAQVAFRDYVNAFDFSRFAAGTP
ncbi:LysR family transcriptional regulator [Mesorhizobium sp. M0244]|uniref:LysR family transcriptional regulator n=1 Tax=Mesorhizobium sp. M0244 TaxID=2956926 RepID=UPI003336587D